MKQRHGLLKEKIRCKLRAISALATDLAIPVNRLIQRLLVLRERKRAGRKYIFEIMLLIILEISQKQTHLVVRLNVHVFVDAAHQTDIVRDTLVASHHLFEHHVQGSLAIIALIATIQCVGQLGADGKNGRSLRVFGLGQLNEEREREVKRSCRR